jgi:hypothetical protein
MGFYDTRCMVTGLALMANDPTTAVLLRASEDGYRPVSLGLQGMYNCYGTIDAVEEDANSGLVGSYFFDQLRDGRLVVGAQEQLEPTDDIDEARSFVDAARRDLGDVEVLRAAIDENVRRLTDRDWPPAS